VLQARIGADRNHHAATDGELIAQLPRDVWSTRRHDDAFVGRMLRPPETAVTVEHLDIAVAQRLEAVARLLGERLVPFDRVDVADHPGQHGRRVP
jgi:hypothetical protein